MHYRLLMQMWTDSSMNLALHRSLAAHFRDGRRRIAWVILGLFPSPLLKDKSVSNTPILTNPTVKSVALLT